MRLKINSGNRGHRLLTIIVLIIAMTLSSGVLRADNGTCNGAGITLPFVDVAGNTFFCQIAEAYFSGLTNGTSATTYSPHDPVSREQMAAFITRTMDQSIKRSRQRAALGQWWTQQVFSAGAITTVGSGPLGVRSDGECLWVANYGDGTVTRVQASDAKVIETWTGMSVPKHVLIASGRVYVAGGENPGKLYMIDPSKPAGAVANLGNICSYPSGMAYDGEHILICGAGAVTNYHVPSGSRITYVNGFVGPAGIIYDGNNFWLTDGGELKKVYVDGQTGTPVNVGSVPQFPTFDGTNIWVPNTGDGSITVVRASTGTVVATLTGNGLAGDIREAGFDGERILVPNLIAHSVSLWRASDLSPLGSFSTGSNSSPYGVCSDGRNFWVTFPDTNRLGRF